MLNKSLHADIAHNSVNRSHAKNVLNKLVQSNKQVADPQAVYRIYYQIPSVRSGSIVHNYFCLHL